jgi:hypothetical protein
MSFIIKNLHKYIQDSDSEVTFLVNSCLSLQISVFETKSGTYELCIFKNLLNSA